MKKPPMDFCTAYHFPRQKEMKDEIFYLGFQVSQKMGGLNYIYIGVECIFWSRLLCFSNLIHFNFEHTQTFIIRQKRKKENYKIYYYIQLNMYTTSSGVFIEKLHYPVHTPIQYNIIPVLRTVEVNVKFISMFTILPIAINDVFQSFIGILAASTFEVGILIKVPR